MLLSKSRFGGLALTLLVVSAAAGTLCSNVKADQPSSPDGTGTYRVSVGHAPGEPAWVKHQEQANLQRYLGSRRLSAAAKSCTPRPVYAQYTYTNATHLAVLFRYFEQVYYCRSGGKVTYFYRYRWAQMSSIVPVVDWNPWSFDGNINSGNDCSNEHCFIRGYRASSRTAVTKGSFSVCAVKIFGWCNHVYPTLSITVFGDGSKPVTSETTG
jgi:hypothetical protein